jgi:ATP-dependent helicase/nuclease subunit A
MSELGDTEWEARMIAGRLKQMHAQGLPIWDDSIASFRPVVFSDMVVLLRAPDKKAESFAKEFSKAGVPLQVARGGFYETSEIADMLSLLQLMDNPLQDLPLLAVLRSPMVGLSLEELAAIRLALRHGPIWTALNHYVRNRPASPSLDATASDRLHERLAAFTGQFARWRRLSRRAALSQCLEAILDETHYESWLAAQPRGPQRLGNVQRLIGLTRQFDQFQRQGLYRFLSFVRAQCEAGVDGESASPGAANAVRLMSIHQSKGLEHPVVVVAGLGKRFNLRELSEPILLDEHFGLCSMVAPPQSGRRYPSLALWLARKRQTSEIYGEEMRLLYVAMTRARDRLILAGTMNRQTLESRWSPRPSARLETTEILRCRSCLDWLGECLSRLQPDSDWGMSGQNALLRWRLLGEPEIEALSHETTSDAGPQAPRPDIGPPDFERLAQIASWKYPFERAVRESAKTSVTAFRKRVAEETDGESRVVLDFDALPATSLPSQSEATEGLSFAEVGIAHHAFLEHVRYGDADDEASLRDQAQGMIDRGALTRDGAACLDFGALTRFLNSEIGLRIRSESSFVCRELPFTAKVTIDTLDRFLKPPTEGPVAHSVGGGAPSRSDEEFVVVQGVVDLAVIKPDGIWILDYKTDRLAASQCAHKAGVYAPQMLLYAAALEGIYKRPVTEGWLYFLNPGVAVPCR